MQVGWILRIMGLAIGLAAAAALIFGFDASHLSPFWIRIAIYKLAFIAALTMLVAGAMIGRRGRVRVDSVDSPR
jgi:hypothetical protein